MIPRKEVQWFAEQMEERLKANEYKGHWDSCDFHYLFMRLKQEVREIETAYKKATKGGVQALSAASPRALSKIVKECGDVGNFAMMIADNTRSWF